VTDEEAVQHYSNKKGDDARPIIVVLGGLFLYLYRISITLSEIFLFLDPKLCDVVDDKTFVKSFLARVHVYVITMTRWESRSTVKISTISTLAVERSGD